MQLNVDFTPSGEILQRYFESRARRSIILGPLGSAKTFTSAFKALRITCEQAPDKDGVRRTAGLVTRRKGTDLETSALKDWTDLTENKFGSRLGKFNWSSPISHELRFKLPDGTRVESTVWFIGLDDPDGMEKVRGMPLTWAWMNELREMPFGIVTMVYGRCGRYPRMEDGGPSWYGLFGDTNMPDPDHWIYRFAEEDRPEGWEFFKQPGGLVKLGGQWAKNPRAENVENLPASYYTDQIAGNSEDWISVYLGAEYGFVREGKPVYPEYSDSVHCKAFELNPKRPISLGLDFGLTPAAVIGQQTVMGAWRWRDEITTENTGAIEFAEIIRRRLTGQYGQLEVERITGDPAGDERAPTDKQTVFEVLKAHGVPAAPASTNDPIKRREAVARCLTRLVDGEPGLLVHPDCRVTRKGMAGGYAYRKMRVGGSGERYQIKPDKNEYSHPCEAGQYLMLGGGEAREILRPRHLHGEQRRPVADNEYAMFG